MSGLDLKFSPVDWLLHDDGRALFLGAGVGSEWASPAGLVVLSRVREPLSPAARNSLTRGR